MDLKNTEKTYSRQMGCCRFQPNIHLTMDRVLPVTFI